jgi:hypothetical protein
MDSNHQTIAAFPDITPSKISSTLSHEYLSRDIKTEKDFQGLIRLMFQFPERDYYIFQEYKAAGGELLRAKEEAGLILFRETEFFFYRHPDPTQRGFVHIERHDGNYETAEEKEIVEKGPMFMRSLLALPERTRRELEVYERLTLEEEFKRRREAAETDYDVFVSYASADKDEAKQIREAIESAGGKVYMDQKLTPGSDFADEIRTALRSSRQLWLLLTPSSLKSDWVLSEWSAAWALGKTIIPILLRCDHPDLPDRLARLECIDFHKYPELIAQMFSGSDASGKPHRWAFTHVFTPGETDRLNELDKFMEWPAHSDPKKGIVYPDPKTNKMWLVYCVSFQRDDSNPVLKKRHVVLEHISDPAIKCPDDVL